MAAGVTIEQIRENDSFWLISQRAYGTGAYFRALYEHNRREFPEPDRLPVGALVEILPREALRERYAGFCPPRDESAASVPTVATNPRAMVPPSNAGDTSSRTYQVRGGESLFDIARHELGQASRYIEILELNQSQLNDQLEDLPKGLTLQLPDR